MYTTTSVSILHPHFQLLLLFSYKTGFQTGKQSNLPVLNGDQSHGLLVDLRPTLSNEPLAAKMSLKPYQLLTHSQLYGETTPSGREYLCYDWAK